MLERAKELPCFWKLEITILGIYFPEEEDAGLIVTLTEDVNDRCRKARIQLGVNADDLEEALVPYCEEQKQLRNPGRDF